MNHVLRSCILENPQCFGFDLLVKKNGTILLAEPSYFSAGRAYYNKPVHLWDNSTGRLIVTDFTTHFSFIIQPVHKEVSADGIAFFIAPIDYEFSDNHNSSGAFLGLFTNESALDVTQNQIVAVEFDTFKNTEFRDHPSDNHVGIDVNSIVSNTSVTWPSSIKNGSTVYAWVSYNSKTQNLSVLLNDADNLVFGENSSVSVIVNLTTILLEWVSVGFSASTGGCNGWLQAEQDYKKEENHMKVYGTRCTRIGLVKRHLVWRNKNLAKMKYLMSRNES
ncbi:agglutinin-2 [Quercus suber]|uniref:Agglutinin-2 n=1 Tax=Quercus suber TaxID=58331 RepID=A0AAW0KLW1_QUESU